MFYMGYDFLQGKLLLLIVNLVRKLPPILIWQHHSPIHYLKNIRISPSFLVVSAIFLTGTGLLATVSMLGTAAANKVANDFDNVKQGGLGEYVSKDARELYNPNDPSGHTLGQGLARFAQNPEEVRNRNRIPWKIYIVRRNRHMSL